MGIMIIDPEILAALERLAAREGTTRTEAFRRALRAECERLPDVETEDLFPRDRVKYLTYKL